MTYSAYPHQPAQPGPPGEPASGKPKLRGRTPLRLSIIFLVIGAISLVIGIVVLAKKSLGQVDDFQRVGIASGSGTVQLTGTGKFLIYYEASNVTNGIDRIPDFVIAVADPSGQPVRLTPYGNRSDGKVDKLTYSEGGHHGAAAFQFTAPTKGAYQVRVRADQTLPADAQVAFGRDIAKGTVAAVLLILAGILLLLTGVVLLIVGLVKRNRHRSQLAGYGGAPAQYAPYGYGQPSGYGPPGEYGPPGGYGQPGGYGPPQQQFPPPQQFPSQQQPPQPPQSWGPPSDPGAGDGPSLAKE